MKDPARFENRSAKLFGDIQPHNRSLPENDSLVRIGPVVATNVMFVNYCVIV